MYGFQILENIKIELNRLGEPENGMVISLSQVINLEKC